ncbi:MAG TPA: FAD:protein FMN transferase, partial [Saprospiraceae bacterium]|nr:FAD:protein FMN transferase [Saprospiraceae bacterium]
FLEEKGIQNYLIELGGEVRGKGINARDSTWVIGIDKPVAYKEGERQLQTTVVLKNKSIATSGSYRKYLEREGKKLSHVIDPATGYPVSHNMISVSVLANDCMTADAFATAFLVMGMDKAFEKATELNLEIYCIYAHDDGKLSVRSTPDFGQ